MPRDIAAWIEQLHDESTCATARRKLAGLGPDDADGVPALIAELEHPGCPHRAMAAVALGAIGAGASSAVPALGRCLQSDNETLCFQAAYALGRIGRADDLLIARLRGLLDHSGGLVRSAAAGSLLQHAPPATDAIATLHRVWQREEHSTPRYWAACGLAEAAPLVREVRPVILEMLHGEWNDELWEIAMSSLGRCDAGEVLPPVLEALRKQKDYRQMYLIGLIADFGERVQPAQAEILRTFQDLQVFRNGDSRVRIHAARAAATVPLDCEHVVNELRLLLNDADERVAQHAARALLGYRSTPSVLRALAEAALNTRAGD